MHCGALRGIAAVHRPAHHPRAAPTLSRARRHAKASRSPNDAAEPLSSPWAAIVSTWAARKQRRRHRGDQEAARTPPAGQRAGRQILIILLFPCRRTTASKGAGSKEVLCAKPSTLACN